jgi:site-specific recombinase XerD
MATQTAILQLVFDRRKRASSTKEGSIELRITYYKKQRFVTTGIRVLPKQWKNGRIINRMDAFELQHSLDLFVANARKVINEQTEAGTFDINNIVEVVNGKQRQRAAENVPESKPLIDFFRERAAIRKYGRADDTQERYDRFIRWFEKWGGMRTFADLTELNILKMDEELERKGMERCSMWFNYHRFLNSFIIDAMDEGLMQRNPYKRIHIDKDKKSKGLDKYLTQDEFDRLMALDLPTDYLRRARDLFLFQTYTCLSYVDMASFDAAKIRNVKGSPMYCGRRGKTKQEFTFMLLKPALQVLDKYGGQLPMMSNQVYNKFIKMLAVMAGINKPVSSHWARHTGATMLLNKGVGLEIVAKVLGHSSTKMTREVYAKLLDETVAVEMSKMI